MDKYQNKYRTTSIRLQGYDYGQNGAYFITICTQNRIHYFGKIVDAMDSKVSTMQLNEIGKLAHQFWIAIPHHFPFVTLGNFVVMPNHVHGIIVIDKVSVEPRLIAAPQSSSDPQSSSPGGATGNKNPMFHKNISRIIRWYKGRCSFEMHKTNPNFKWQSKFHDHIIRNAKSFERISNYIANNPMNWQKR